MVIGIDIDDCIVKNSNYFFTHILEEDLPKEILEDIKNNLESIMAGHVPDRLKPVLAPIWKRYNDLYPVYENAADVINSFRELNDTIFIVTGRGEELLEGSEDQTIRNLKRYGVMFDDIFFNIRDKAQFSVTHALDVAIDDSMYHAKRIHESGIKTILFTNSINKTSSAPLYRADNWRDVDFIVNQKIRRLF